MKLITVHLPNDQVSGLDELVRNGRYPNRSEAIRVGIRDLIRTEYLIEESVKRNMSPNLIQSEIENQIQEII